MHVVGACHKCRMTRINVKRSNDTTTEEKVEGVHKDGFVGEIRRYKKNKSCDLDEKGTCSSEASNSHKESESALSSDKKPTREATKENKFATVCIITLFRMILLRLGTKWRMTTRA